MMASRYRIGFDIGGTFTDFVLLDDARGGEGCFGNGRGTVTMTSNQNVFAVFATSGGSGPAGVAALGAMQQRQATGSSPTVGTSAAAAIMSARVV